MGTQMPAWMPRECRALLVCEVGVMKLGQKCPCAFGRLAVSAGPGGGVGGVATTGWAWGWAVGGTAQPPPGRPGWENHDDVGIILKTFHSFGSSTFSTGLRARNPGVIYCSSILVACAGPWAWPEKQPAESPWGRGEGWHSSPELQRGGPPGGDRRDPGCP